jgi:peptidyl-prolyl cis-trans isomerase A (cyclophilin A)
MKSIYLSILLCSSLLAQAPASKAQAPKEPPRGPGSKPSLMNPASLRMKAPDLYRAQFTTTKGDFVVEVHRDWAPIGADRFYNLVKNGFFDDASFFRVIKGFMAQFGISSNPAINRAWQNANIKDDPVKQGNKRGNVVFATAGPNTRTTQIFINFADNTQLDAQGFAAFGNVVEGMDVVDKIYSGYGETIQSVGHITNEGRPYLDKNFSQMDRIKTAKIMP